MQTDAEVAAIAAGLTALRAKTLRSITAKANPIDRCGYQLANNRPAQWLVRAGLLDDFDNSCGGDRHDGRYVEWRYALTPLGLRVAQHLKQENANG